MFDRDRGWLRPCAICVSTVREVFSTVAPGMFRSSLEVCFDRARDLFRPCLRYLSAVARGMFQSPREVCFDLLELCFRQSSI